MSSFEERLLLVMTVRRWLVACVVLLLIGGAGGWFGGRWYLYRQIEAKAAEIQAAVMKSAEDFSNTFKANRAAAEAKAKKANGR